MGKIMYEQPKSYTFVEFIKMHCIIENEFIDEFFSQFNENNINTYNDFIIDLNILLKWLEIKSEKRFIENLRKRFKLNIDYIINITNSKTSEFSKKSEYFLTTESAKHICMTTKSLKGDKVRDYFIQIEKVLNKYYSHIITSLQKKEVELINGKRPKVNPNHGVIYVFKIPKEYGDDMYKIGKTVNINKRTNSHNCALPKKLEKVFEYEVLDYSQIEVCVKNELKNNRYRNDREIYIANIDEIKKIIAMCDKFHQLSGDILNGKFKNMVDNVDITDLLILNIVKSNTEEIAIANIAKATCDQEGGFEYKYKKYKSKYINLQKKVETIT